MHPLYQDIVIKSLADIIERLSDHHGDLKVKEIINHATTSGREIIENALRTRQQEGRAKPSPRTISLPEERTEGTGGDVEANNGGELNSQSFTPKNKEVAASRKGEDQRISLPMHQALTI